MNGFRKYLRPADISAQIRMERQRHKGAFLLVEGATDIRRFSKFFDPVGCSLVNCYGKENVIGAVDIEENKGREDILGLVDADFDRLTGVDLEADNVFVSNFHDYDVDKFGTDVIGRYLAEFGRADKVEALGGHTGCVAVLLESLKPLSAARYANERYEIGYSFKGLEYEAFFNGETIDVDRLVDHLSQGRFGSQQHRETLRARIDQFASSQIDLWQVTNGHDLMAALGIALRGRLGDRKIQQTWRSEVESHLRLAFDASDFEMTGMLARVTAWEQRSAARSILRR